MIENQKVQPINNPPLQNNQEVEIKPQRSNRKPLIIIILAIVVIVIGGTIVSSKNKSSNTSTDEESAFEGLPQADKNIQVELVAVEKGKIYTLTVSKIPKEVTGVEYEMQYKTEGPDGKEKIEGIFGTAQVQNGSFNKEVILGTESSGVRRYHKLTDGKATLTLKFVAAKGASRLQKKFDLL